LVPFASVFWPTLLLKLLPTFAELPWAVPSVVVQPATGKPIRSALASRRAGKDRAHLSMGLLGSRVG
jgi:hypothetical protein